MGEEDMGGSMVAGEDMGAAMDSMEQYMKGGQAAASRPAMA